MAITLLKTHHIDDCDIPFLSDDQRPLLLSNKFSIVAENNDEGASNIEEIFNWIKENVNSFYHVRGPKHDQETITYTVYISDSDEASLLETTFATNDAMLSRDTNIEEHDLLLLTVENRNALLSNKFIIRSSNNDDAEDEIKNVQEWLKENVRHHYHLRGPEQDQDSVKYYMYFVDEEESVQFKLTFPSK